MASLTEADVMAAIADVAWQHLRWTGPISPDLPLVEALALDSLRQLTLIVEIENRFRIRFDQEDDSSVKTFRDLTALIGRKLAQRTSDAR
jgi:acyl carrier protein